MRIISYRTTMPFDNRNNGPDASLSPATQKSVMPFNNVHTIQDVLDGRKYDSLHGGGNWSSGEDVDKSFKDTGDSYKRRERDMEIIQRMQDGTERPSQQWRVKVPGGSKTFVSLDTLQRYIRENKIPFSYISRVAQRVEETGANRVSMVADAVNKCFMVESINTKMGIKETGSAFCVSSNYFVTCAHVIKKYDKNNKELSDNFSEGIFVNLVHQGLRHKAEVIDINLSWDIALLKCDIDAIPFEIDKNILVGDGVITIGSPHGYENNVSDGIIGSIGRDIFSYEDAPKYMFIDLAVFPGNSGGPIIKESNGKVVGMITMVVSEGNSGYGLNAGLPSSYIENFCKRILI